MDREQILRLLGEREAVGRVEVARLEEEAERLTVLIEACRREVDRLAVAREVLSGLAEELPGAVRVGHDLKPEPIMLDQLLTVLGEAGRPVRCKDVLVVLGEDPAVARRVERVRNRLKKLVVAGRVVETEPGLFTLAAESGSSPG
ncbi:hypothetical protein [Actinoplanes subtropicus]|uniref:hypothetical protein n=1 Tax=Actinoplanes subtropicus TaxID=543632 RepID=UPI00069164D6|nr:hypothetical protein [Actinoplanes subtropicus]